MKHRVKFETNAAFLGVYALSGVLAVSYRVSLLSYPYPRALFEPLDVSMILSRDCANRSIPLGLTGPLTKERKSVGDPYDIRAFVSGLVCAGVDRGLESCP